MVYFLKGTDIANYVDNTTPYSAAETEKCVIEKLCDLSASPFKWLKSDISPSEHISFICLNEKAL